MGHEQDILLYAKRTTGMEYYCTVKAPLGQVSLLGGHIHNTPRQLFPAWEVQLERGKTKKNKE